MTVVEKLRAANEKYGLFSRGDSVLIAVSGGPDSVALLRVLYEIRHELHLRLEVAHVEHGIRGEEAIEDARFVGRLCAELCLPFHLKRVDLPNIKLAAGKGNLEALGREARYDFFFWLACARGILKVATAHTQDDQAETLLMRLFRGAGRTGLTGIRPVSRLRPQAASPLALVRPLLGCSKAELIGFLVINGISYRWDRTNEDTTLLRNWVRNDLLPQLAERFDLRLSGRLARQAEIIGQENDFLDSIAGDLLEKCRTGAALRRQLLIAQEKAIQRRVLRMWLEERRGNLRGIDLEHIEELLRLIEEGPAHGRLSLPGGWELVKEYDTVILRKRCAPPMRSTYSYPLLWGRRIMLSEAAMTIESERLEPPSGTRPRNLWEAVFDGAEVDEPLLVRTCLPGDRFQPLGMTGHKKVKDLFIEKKVPLSRRSSYPLVCTRDQVLWVPGYGRSDFAKVGPQTKMILRLNAKEDGKLSSNSLIDRTGCVC